MKFRVSAKDLSIFIGFCIFLLFLTAIAVINVMSLINEGEIAGLNPLPAFTGKYLFVTLFVFIGVIVVIFISVSDTVFHHEKGAGFGISIGEKEEKGYSRWCTEKEMKKARDMYKIGIKDETADYAGVVFINDGKNMWVDNGENHTLVIGVTGSGKTTAVVDPLIYSLIKHGESMVITDPKGEIYQNHGELLKARGYKLVILNFRDPQKGNAWNPLTLPYRLYQEGNIDKSIELVDDVAQNIASDPKAQDPFWGNSSADYFAGCALGLMADAKEEEVNINSISLMTTVGEEKFGVGSNYIKEYFLLKGETSSAYTFASNTINSPSDTKGGILSTFRQKIRVFSTKQDLSEMLAYSDFDMRNIGKEKTAVFMVIHDEKTTYHALATIFIKQCYETLISVAQENHGPLPVRTNFILDEFANMPRLKDVTTMVTAARSRHIRFTFIIQNYAQLNEVYGKEDAETIRSNCGNLFYLLTTELAALEEISKLCGEVKSKKDDKTASVPLVTVSDLQHMKYNEVIILKNRSNPFKTQLKQGFDTDWGDQEFGKCDFFVRDKKEIQLFDVKEFVKLRKNNGKSEPAGGNPFGASPFGGDGLFGGASPFGGNNPFGGASGGEMPRKIPTFEEFLAAKNAAKKAEEKNEEKPDFNIDDLVKKIDEKIAELDRNEKEKAAELNNEPKKPELTNRQVLNPINEGSINPSKVEPKVDSMISSPVNTPEIKEVPKSFDQLINDNQIVKPTTEPVRTELVSKPVQETVPSFSEFVKMNNEPKTVTPVNGVNEIHTVPNQAVNQSNNFAELINSQNGKTPTTPTTPVTNPVKVDVESKATTNSKEEPFFDDFFE